MGNEIQKYSDFEKEGGKQNYMFFGNLKNIKKMVDEMLEMDEQKIDDILSEHDWASDHISVATENLDQVYHFLVSKDSE
jgi:hypothetical protein